jgi:glycosyltransferase involved in cell wall biosynthesis
MDTLAAPPSALHVATPYGRLAGSSRVRVFEWLDRIAAPAVVSSYISHRNANPAHLARHPLAVLAAERRLRRMASPRAERMLLHREASPLSRGELERRLLTTARFAVYDLDDALQWDWGEGGRMRRIAPKAPKALLAARHADRVIAGSPVLAEWAAEHNQDVVLIPSCVAPDRYRQKSDYGVREPPRLGWIGSRGNEAYLQLIAPALEELHRRVGARVTVIGTTERTLGELERLIDRVAWSEASQHTELARLDVGLMPVPDEPYTRGKCGYKLLQYGAAGLPAVGSPIGVNADILRRFGMPAPERAADWVDAVLGLLESSEAERARLGRGALDVVRSAYSYDAWLARWQQAVAAT